MKMSKRAGLGALVALVLLMSIVLVAASSALAADPNISGNVAPDITEDEKTKAIEIARNDPKVKEMLPKDAQVMRVEIPSFAKRGDRIYDVVFKSGEFTHTITVNLVSGEVQGSVSTRGEIPKTEDIPLPVFREDVIVYFKEMPASINIFASKYGVKPIFVNPDIKMAAFETLPVGENGRVSQKTQDIVNQFSKDPFVEKAFRDEYLFISAKTGYLVTSAETGYYSTDPLIQGPEYYEKLGVEYIPNIVRVGFWRTPRSLEEFASKYGGKLMELSDADKFFMTAGFETSNITEFINKISTDPYVARVALVDTEPSLGIVSANNSPETADTPKASGFESIISILLLISVIFLVRRR